MVRRRSTVRFRKGAPGKRIFSDTDSIEEQAKASDGGQNSAPQVSALWPDAVLSVAVSWHFQMAVVLPFGRRSAGQQSSLTGGPAQVPGSTVPLGSCVPGEHPGDS